MKVLTIAPERLTEECTKFTDIRLNQFLEKYGAFKKGHLSIKKTEKINDIANPHQLSAFSRVLDFFKEKEKVFTAHKDRLFNYEIKGNELSDIEVPLVTFLNNVADSDYDFARKTIVLTSGTFWENYRISRDYIIHYLSKMCDKGAFVKIFSNSTKVSDLPRCIYKDSYFGYTNPLPLHFIKIDSDYLFLEFPHTEKTKFRLAVFLDLNNLKDEWRNGFTKEDLSKFLNELVFETL